MSADDSRNPGSIETALEDLDTREAIDSVMACLADEERRVAVQCLSEASGPMTVEALGERVAKRSNPSSAGPAWDDAKREVTVSLIHVHLPKMRAADVVAVDPETDTVRSGARFETAETLREVV